MLQYIVSVEYDTPFDTVKTDLTINGPRDLRTTLIKLNEPDLKDFVARKTGEDPEMIGKVTVISVTSEEPVVLPGGDQLVVFAMNLHYNEKENHDGE